MQEEVPVVPTKALLFGWCLPNSKCHTECKTEFTLDNKTYKCECECHTQKASKK